MGLSQMTAGSDHGVCLVSLARHIYTRMLARSRVVDTEVMPEVMKQHNSPQAVCDDDDDDDDDDVQN